MEKISQIAHIREELRDHLPYTFASTLAGIVALALFSYGLSRTGSGAGVQFSDVSVVLFHFFHPLHVFFSATTVAAMFGRHERDFLKAIGIGIAGSVVPCVLSDILFPYLGGTLLGIPMSFHLDFVLQPFWMSVVLLSGIGVGYFISDRIAQITLFSHAIHVFISTMATLTYMTGFGFSEWIRHLVFVALICMVSVVVVCCTGDVVIPHLFIEGDHRHS